MLRFDNIVFGPIHSRRLGSSLGINILPENGKLCNFDCIYCECGWNKDGTGDRNMPSAAEVSKALEAKLSECAEKGTVIDSITFSGHGEPTLNPHFPEIAAMTVKLRDRLYPEAEVSVLSNATTAADPKIFEALRMIDNPIMKIDASTAEGVALVRLWSGSMGISSSRPCFSGHRSSIRPRLTISPAGWISSAGWNLARSWFILWTGRLRKRI